MVCVVGLEVAPRPSTPVQGPSEIYLPKLKKVVFSSSVWVYTPGRGRFKSDGTTEGRVSVQKIPHESFIQSKVWFRTTRTEALYKKSCHTNDIWRDVPTPTLPLPSGEMTSLKSHTEEVRQGNHWNVQESCRKSFGGRTMNVNPYIPLPSRQHAPDIHLKQL